MASEDKARVFVGDSEWVAINPIAGFEFAFVIDGPDIVWCQANDIGFAGMPDFTALGFLFDQTMSFEDFTGGTALWPRDIGVAWFEEI